MPKINPNKYPNNIIQLLRNKISIPITIKMLLLFSSLLLLAQSATSPFIIDNETYYIQTIKWLNEYGFVSGLANLHLFASVQRLFTLGDLG